MTAPFPYECLETIDSTNNFLKRRPDIWSKNFYTVRALEQTQGRGRYGRNWHSGKNNLTFSFIYNFNIPSDISAITICAGLALRKALSIITGNQILLKWPNDVTFRGKKLGGILSEMIKGSDSRVLIFGIGVNLNLENMPVEITEKSISLQDITNLDLQPELILNTILQEMEKYLAIYTSPLPKTILTEFKENCDYNANQVSLHNDGKVEKKKVNIKGINENGLLVILSPDGTPEFVNAYELEFN